jgi:DNA-binding response OmpR family regulator
MVRTSWRLLAARPAAAPHLPVIGLTRRGDLKTKLAAFEAGVDDILTVPFAPEELLARVLALVRRGYSAPVTFTPTIKIGDFEIDILNHIARTGLAELHLTSLEESVLVITSGHPGCGRGADGGALLATVTRASGRRSPRSS